MDSGTPQRTYEEELRFRAKRELRNRYRMLRDAHPASALAERSARLVDQVIQSKLWADARTVGLFMSMGSEVQVDRLVAMRGERRIAIPRVADDGLLHFHAPWDRSPTAVLVMSSFGVQEPDPSAPVVPLESMDLVLVPAIAADDRGHRIGYGAGYYDRTFARSPSVVRAIVLYDFQLIAEVPEWSGDLKCQWIITDKRVLAARSDET